MATNFASYQDEHPDDPPPAAESASNTRFSDNDWEAEEGGLPLSGDRRSQGPTSGSSGARGGFGNGLGADERSVDPYNTSLPMRLEIEAVAAYVGLPPAGGALLLMFEHKNDYVRFHAWQSSLVFTVLFVSHFSLAAVGARLLTKALFRSCISSSRSRESSV